MLDDPNSFATRRPRRHLPALCRWLGFAIMETFFRERQTPDGQLHGGWGD
jgi:hypothetical protein